MLKKRMYVISPKFKLSVESTQSIPDPRESKHRTVDTRVKIQFDIHENDTTKYTSQLKNTSTTHSSFLVFVLQLYVTF